MTFSEKPVPQPHDLKETTESTADSPSGDYGFSIYTREPKAFSFYDWQKISMEKGKTAEECVWRVSYYSNGSRSNKSQKPRSLEF